MLLELPEAVLDLGPLETFGFTAGPPGLVGKAVLRVLTLEADVDEARLEADVAEAVEEGIAHCYLDYYEPSDPDGHFDNRSLAVHYRECRPQLLPTVLALRPYDDAIVGLTALSRAGVRLVALPFFGQWSNPAVDGLSIEFLPRVRADSAEALLCAMVAKLDLPAEDIVVVAGSEWVAATAMAVGIPTIWLDRVRRARSFQAGPNRWGRWTSTHHRWSHPEPVPLIADDLAHAAVQLLGLRRRR